MNSDALWDLGVLRKLDGVGEASPDSKTACPMAGPGDTVVARSPHTTDRVRGAAADQARSVLTADS